jgi:hypothetical protein
MNKTTQIIWNGVDGYKEVERLDQDDRFEQMEDGSFKLYTRTESFTSFPVVQIAEADVPRDEDGELDFDGLFVTESFNIYRAA